MLPKLKLKPVAPHTKPGVFISFEENAQPSQDLVAFPAGWPEARYFGVFETYWDKAVERAEHRGEFLYPVSIEEPRHSQLDRVDIHYAVYIPRPEHAIGLFCCLHEIAHYLHGDLDVNVTDPLRRQRFELLASEAAIRWMRDAGVNDSAAPDFALSCLNNYGVDVEEAREVLRYA